MSTDIQPEVHGHEVLHLLHEAATPLTRETLVAEAARLWGADARFCTCSAFGMTLQELLGFLIARGKVVEQGGVLRTDMSQVCGHGDDHHHHH